MCTQQKCKLKLYGRGIIFTTLWYMKNAHCCVCLENLYNKLQVQMHLNFLSLDKKNILNITVQWGLILYAAHVTPSYKAESVLLSGLLHNVWTACSSSYFAVKAVFPARKIYFEYFSVKVCQEAVCLLGCWINLDLNLKWWGWKLNFRQFIIHFLFVHSFVLFLFYFFCPMCTYIREIEQDLAISQYTY